MGHDPRGPLTVDRVDAWMAALEARHLADLTFREAARSLRALSSIYVERRGNLAQGAALSGAGKRAAFALVYGPLHFLLLRHIGEQRRSTIGAVPALVDLGCGTGASGAGLIEGLRAHSPMPSVNIVAVDRHPWAAEEARTTYAAFDLRARVHVGDLVAEPLPPRALAVAAFAVNEVSQEARERLLERLLRHHDQGGGVLIVEPLAGAVAPWWSGWSRAFLERNGEAAEWRVRVPLPPLIVKFDRSSGLDHRELTARSLLLAAR